MGRGVGMALVAADGVVAGGVYAARKRIAAPAFLVAMRDSNEGVQQMAREALEKIIPAGTPVRVA